jgi:cyanophycinase
VTDDDACLVRGMASDPRRSERSKAGPGGAPMHILLIGGGWDPEAAQTLYGPFLAAAEPRRRVVCVVLDEGSGSEYFRKVHTALAAAADCEPIPVLIPIGARFDPAALEDADGLLICGGLTPGYADAIVPARDQIRDWLAQTGAPYAGFSAGASISAELALVGGWLDNGTPVCAEDISEDLDPLTMRAGLGLVPVTIDVHCAQWGTLSRAVAAVRSGVPEVWAIDENTSVVVTERGAEVHGIGAVYRLREAHAAITLTWHRAGTHLD